MNDEILSPSLELKMVTSQMIRANPSIAVIDVTKPVCPELVDGEVEKTRIYGSDNKGIRDGDKKFMSNDEFIPGVGFQFLNKLKEETVGF